MSHHFENEHCLNTNFDFRVKGLLQNLMFYQFSHVFLRMSIWKRITIHIVEFTYILLNLNKCI